MIATPFHIRKMGDDLRKEAVKSLDKIMTVIHGRHGQETHNSIQETVDSASFFWLCEVAGRDPAEEHFRFVSELNIAHENGRIIEKQGEFK